jgi:hypothetical protein
MNFNKQWKLFVDKDIFYLLLKQSKLDKYKNSSNIKLV